MGFRFTIAKYVQRVNMLGGDQLPPASAWREGKILPLHYVQGQNDRLGRKGWQEDRGVRKRVIILGL